MSYISRADVLALAESGRLVSNGNYKSVVSAINAIPAADVVEVIRCKDCRWGREACGNIECLVDTNIPPEYHGYEWFCPNGERREDG